MNSRCIFDKPLCLYAFVLHLALPAPYTLGVRTALYNYLFAKKHNGVFVLRVEDTDQNRFVDGAESYITKTLDWLGIRPDESPNSPGAFGPYRQSERKAGYLSHAQLLVKTGNAYLAFDSSDELLKLREAAEQKGSDFYIIGKIDVA